MYTLETIENLISRSLDRCFDPKRILQERPLMIRDLKEVLHTIRGSEEKSPYNRKLYFVEVEKMLTLLAQHFGYSINQIIVRNNKPEFSEVRQIFYYLAKKHSTLSYRNIGQILGGRDHSTVLFGFRNFKDVLQVDKNMRAKVVLVENKILGELYKDDEHTQ